MNKCPIKDTKNDKIVNELKQQVKELQHENVQLKYYSDFFKTIIRESGSIIKKSIGPFAQITTKYKNAPNLKTLTMDMVVDIEKDEFKLGCEINYQYKNKTLASYLGNFIISIYKKEDPNAQSIWTTDVSRLTYLIKDLIDNKNSAWVMDKQGLKTGTKIIRPLLSHIKDISFKMHKIVCIKLANETSTNKMEYLMNLSKQSSYIIKDIKEGILENEILKYISPHLSYNKKQLDS